MTEERRLGRDVAVVGQDPRFGGGFRTMATVFWNATVALGRAPHLFFLSREHALRVLPPRISRLRPRRELFHLPFDGTALPSVLPEFDAVNQLVGGVRLARRVRRSRTVFVVATTAPYGIGAALSRRPYALWLATGLESEWRARRAGLSATRRAAIAINRPFLLRLERAVIRRARHVYAISPASRLTVAAAGGVAPDRVDVLAIPVDTDAFTPEPDEAWRERAEAAPVLVFLGRAADPRKNVALLARALPAIRREIPSVRVRLIGERPVREVADALGDHAEILGPVNDPVPPLRSATLFVLPSLQEGFGIVVAEAFACGLPAVVTPSGGPEELVRESGGGIVLDGFEPEALAAAVVALLRDPERAAAMRQAAREFVRREHSSDRLRDRLAAAYAELDG